MKLICILFFIFVLQVEAQRRSPSRHESTPGEQSVRSRGRSRFSNPDNEPAIENSNRRGSFRRRPVSTEPPIEVPVERQNYPQQITPSTISYAVVENIDEGVPPPLPKASSDGGFESQNIQTKQIETQFPGIGTETQRTYEEDPIPTVKIDSDRDSNSGTLNNIELPKSTEKPVPITRNNVRNGVKSGSEKRTDVRHGSSRQVTDNTSRNGSSRPSNENTISRNSPSRTRGRNSIPAQQHTIPRTSINENQQILSVITDNEAPPLKTEALNAFPSVETSKDENEYRKEIVRNSVPQLPQPNVFSTEIRESSSKKPVRKAIRTRVTNNGQLETNVPISRGGLNPRIVENYEPAARVTSPRPSVNSRTVEEYSPPLRSRTLGSPRELEHDSTKKIRAGINTRNEEPAHSPRSRTRTVKRPTESAAVQSIPSRTNQRGTRRRPDVSTTPAALPRRGPSVFSEDIPLTRSRTGRKIGYLEKTKTQIDSSRSVRTRNSRTQKDGSEATTEKINVPGRRQGSKFTADELPQVVSKSPRHRFNARTSLNIDETKLEVLPLFEGETKIISENGRRPNQLEPLMSSFTGSENLVIKSPERSTPSVSTRSGYSISKKEAVGSHSSFTRKPYKRTKESVVISEVTEVTSKRTITRKPIAKPGADVKSKSLRPKSTNKLTSSEEDISDNDNYPEPFKALIQSKKKSKESRTLNAPETTATAKKAERIVSSSEAPRSVLATPKEAPSSTTAESIKYVEDLDNEVQPKASSTSTTLRTTRKRFYPIGKNLEYLKNKKSTTSPRKLVSRSTLAPAKEPKDHKFHSKFNLVTKNEVYSTLKPIKGTSRNLYNGRKNKEYIKNSINATRSSLTSAKNRQVPHTPVQKSSKYSSKYRINTPSRSVSRSSTAPPAYIPTVPAVRAYTPTVKFQEDPESGLEIISIDDPPKSISSANLISGDYHPSEEAKSNSLDTQNDAKTTKKTPSIIESIINSITGINIPTDPSDKVSTSSTTVEPTKSSAILSLAPKKTPKKSDETDDLTHTKIKSNKRDASTSEKPTTVIQRILNSLSAIQAATTTETSTVAVTDSPNYVTKQVGSNFNTLSSGTTTPSRLNRETASFFSTFAHSTTINPLVVFDTISEEQILQKRTIGKLLEILNSLTTPRPDSSTKPTESTNLVYVTPKLANYFYSTPSIISDSMKSLNSTNITDSTPQPLTSSISTMTVTTTESSSETVTTEVSSSTTSEIVNNSVTPLSVSSELSTTESIENEIISTTNPSRIASIISNIRNLLAPTTTPPAPLTSISMETTAFSTMTTTSTTQESTSISPEVFNSANTTSSSTNSIPPTVTETSVSNTSIDSTTIAADNLDTSNTELDPNSSTMSSPEATFSYTSTIPTFSKFQVSPDSVAIFSVNDLLSNAITPDDFLTTTVSIPTRAPDAIVSTGSSTFEPFDISTFMTQSRITSTPTETVGTTDSIMTKSFTESSTLSSNGDTTMISPYSSNEVTTTNNSVVTSPDSTNASSTSSGRTGKLLQRLEDDVSNSIDSSSMGPDYFIFAVLPNNTILRKKPVTFPKETPFVIVGVFPNNTIIRKFPNGTLVPMEPVIRVSGFDTRPNPPPLPDITSNQVTPDQGDQADNPNLETVSSMTSTVPSVSVNNNSTTQSKPESVTMMTMDASNTTTVESVENENITTTSSNNLSIDNVVSSTTPVSTTTLPSISELLDGKLVQAFNSLVNNTTPNQESTTKRTTEIISLEQLLRQQNVVKTWNRLEDNNLDIDSKVEENKIPTTDNLIVKHSNIAATTGIPFFLNNIISTLQSMRSTGFAIKPTSQLPLMTTSQATTSFVTTTTTSLPTTVTTSPSITTTAAPTTTTTAATTTTSPAPTTITTVTPITTTTTTTTLAPTTTTTAPTTTTSTTTSTTTTPITTTMKTGDPTTSTPYTSHPVVSARSGKALPSSTLFPYFNPNDFPLLSIFSTERTRRTNVEEFSTTKKPSTTSKTTTTRIEETTESLESLLKKPIDSIKPKKQLTEQQKKDLEMIRQLEKEQAAILKQLSFLTNLNLNTNSFSNGKSSDSLASRIIALAKEREERKIKSTTTTTTSTTTTTTTTTTTPRPTTTTLTTTLKTIPTNENEERMRQIENLIKLLNMNGITPSPEKSSSYGTSNDAILAALLKERGIGPATPKQLAEQIEQSGVFTVPNEITTNPTTKPTKATTKPTKKRRLTTQPTRGPILQRLSWLLNAIAPPPTKQPSRKPKATTKKPKTTTQKTTPKTVEEDILTSEPTHNTLMVTPPPSGDPKKTLSQEDIQKLIKQLEAIQKNPSTAKDFDLTSFKSLQNLNKNNVQVFMPGSSGVSQRETTKAVTRAVTQKSTSLNSIDISELDTSTIKSKGRSRAIRTSTLSSSEVSNSILDDVEDAPPVKKSKPTLSPVKLKPVNGVSDEAGSMIRGRLLSAAVNVTRAISGFLGSAFQEAVHSLARAMSGGSFANYLASSSILPHNQSTSDGAASSFQTMMASGSQLVGNFAQGSSTMVKDTGE